MENNFITYILENIFLFLPLFLVGIVVTLYLYITGKKDHFTEKKDADTDYIKLAKYKINVYVLIYLFLCITLIVLGILSNFILPTFIGGLIALIPIIMIAILRFFSNDSKAV